MSASQALLLPGIPVSGIWSPGELKKLRLPTPTDAREQEAISEVLTIADQEVDALSQRLVWLNHEKKALMQQLLTGKRRVKVDSNAA